MCRCAGLQLPATARRRCAHGRRITRPPARFPRFPPAAPCAPAPAPAPPASPLRPRSSFLPCWQARKPINRNNHNNHDNHNHALSPSNFRACRTCKLPGYKKFDKPRQLVCQQFAAPAGCCRCCRGSLNMFCQYIYLRMYVIPAADLDRSLHQNFRACRPCKLSGSGGRGELCGLSRRRRRGRGLLVQPEDAGADRGR